MSPAKRHLAEFLDLPSRHVPLGIDQVGNYPILAQCLAVWRQDAEGGIPATVDPVAMPPASIKGISLVEWDAEAGDWSIRLSASLIDSRIGRNPQGTSLAQNLRGQDLEDMRASINRFIERGEPALLRREFTSRSGWMWSYVCLMLPLSSDGVKRDRYAAIFDPETFGRRLED